MAMDEAIRQRLLQNNPFSSNAAGDPREHQYPDVESVDQKVSQFIINVIAQKKKHPGTPRAAAVLGETGSGKTHLIGRLIKAGSDGEIPFSFAYIRPFIDPNRAFRYLLRETFSNLNNKSFSENQYSQIQYVCGQIFTRVLFKVAEQKSDDHMLAKARDCQDNPLKALKLNIKPPKRKAWLNFTRNFLKEKHDELSSRFLNVLLQYFFYDEKRSAASRWLMGKAIDDEDCKLLGVPDRSGLNAAELEGEAQEILKSLDLILDKYGDRPLIVFFDQLENLNSDVLLDKFKILVWFLSDTTRAMMPVAFFRGMDWENRFLPKLDDTIASRFKNNLFMLKGCTQKQARTIVQYRLDLVLSDLERPHPLYPFYPDHSEEFEKRINPKIKWPRQVINRANQMLFSILEIQSDPKTDNQILTNALKARYEEILSNYSQFEPDEGRLTLALELYLGNRPSTASYPSISLERTPKDVKYIDLQGVIEYPTGPKYRTAFLIDVELHHRSVGASLKQAVIFLGKHPSHKAIYIRDMRCAFPELPKWPKTNQLLEEFKNLGGCTVFLDKKAAAWWYALALLKFDVEAGDVTREDGSALTIDQLTQFINDCLNGQSYPAFSVVDKYLGKQETIPPPAPPAPDPPPKNPDIPKMVVDLLIEAPVKMLKADLLVAKISEQYPNVTTVDDLLIILEDFHDRFSFIRAIDGTIVKLKLEWLNAQA